MAMVSLQDRPFYQYEMKPMESFRVPTTIGSKRGRDLQVTSTQNALYDPSSLELL
jgi:hypothetical protein